MHGSTHSEEAEETLVVIRAIEYSVETSVRTTYYGPWYYGCLWIFVCDVCR